MSALPAIPSPYIHSSQKRRKNIWYSIKDGNWSDPNTWISNALSYAQWNFNYPGQSISTPVFPQVGDDVFINHTVTLDVGSASVPIVVNNLYVAGTFKVDNSSRVVNVNGDIQAVGAVDFTSSNVNLTLFGVNNSIVNFIAGNSTVTYARIGDQTVMNLSYKNLTTINSGTKYTTSNLSITGNLIVTTSSTLELLTYNLSVGGSTTVSVSGVLSKSGSGSVLFIGNLAVATSSPALVNFSIGNPAVEFRGGINFGQFTDSWLSGTGNFIFSTNNQVITGGGGGAFIHNFDGNVLISGAITVTVNAGTNFGIQFNQPVTGDNASSKLLNSGTIYFGMTTLPMLTGIFDYTTNPNVIGYAFNGNYILPYTTYSGLYISGTGTKTAQGNTIINNTLSIVNLGTFELSTYDLTISTTTLISSGTLSKSGFGNILFIGSLSLGSSTANVLNFTGNPSVEFRGGINWGPFGATLNGVGTWSITTNNQAWSLSTSIIIVPYNILISGAITLTISFGSGLEIYVFTGTITGDNVLSVLDNRTNINYQNAAQPMATGVLECNAAANTFKYNGNNSQAIKGGNYRTVEFGGTSTPNNKTLQGNVVTTGYTTTGNATIILNGFSIT